MNPDPLSILIGLALYPVSRMYWRTFISGINRLRDYKESKETPKAENFPSVTRIVPGYVANFRLVDEYVQKVLPWEEGEYATQA